MDITLFSYLTLVPINIREEKKHFIVEDMNSGEFYEMPKICIDAIDLLNSGHSLGETKQHLEEKFPEEEVDLLDFVEQLLSLQLIAIMDGKEIVPKQKENNKEHLRFLWISPKVGKFFFNKVALFFYVILSILNAFLLVSHPNLFPHYQDLFISNYMVFNIIAFLVLTFCTVLIHEFGHILAMRAQNLSTKLNVGHRLFLLVLESDISTVWKLPSKERNVIYIAGLCFDMVILFFALISQLIFVSGSGIFLRLMSVVVLNTFLRIVYQCCIYMKTDLYYVFENLSGCHNIMENAQRLIRRWLPIKKTHVHEEVVFTGEKKTVFTYSIFYLLGVVLTVSIYIIFYIPQLLFAWKKVLPGFAKGFGSYSFWDATLFSLQILIGLALLLYSWRKKYLKR
ncbi:hypothetical protein M3226_11115 [Neobacillus cucumis]|uniref:hypothetical protein n=1 Tax=Neobacillus cucumis TaxID=1740721 RepID=UPI00203C5459|nr:hypothetical protein [Neobacillus cucumis]MCM3726234.1 hypothetical protein [Neobacillus cucumis]